MLKEFVRDSVIKKMNKDEAKDSNGWYHVKSRPRLFQFMHDELALTASERKEGRTLVDALGPADYDSASNSEDYLSDASMESVEPDMSNVPVETRGDASSHQVLLIQMTT